MFVCTVGRLSFVYLFYSIAPPESLVDPVGEQKPTDVRLVSFHRAGGDVWPLLCVSDYENSRAGEKGTIASRHRIVAAAAWQRRGGVDGAPVDAR